MTRPIYQLTLAQLLAGFSKGSFLPSEVAESFLKRIDQSDHNAFLYVDPDGVMSAAKQSDARWQRQRLGENLCGALEGLPIAVKDNFCVRDVPTTAASKILEGFRPPYESSVTQRLWTAGAFMLGKTNMDEFAMGSGNLTSAKGPVKNPWQRKNAPDIQLVPGGSSGGSAAAVAAGLAPVALGTDTGGSIRQPSAYCGLVGVKPTYGRCSRYGIVAYASSFDQPGPMCRTVQDAAIVLQAMAGHDPKDSTSAHQPVPNLMKNLHQGVRGLKIGLPKEYKQVSVDSDVTQAWDNAAEWLRKAGAVVQSVDLPHIAHALEVYSVLTFSEASSNFARYDGIRYGFRAEANDLETLYKETRDQGFGPEVKRRLLSGTHILSQKGFDVYFRQAQKVRRLIFNDFNQALNQVDALLFPTAPESAFGWDEVSNDPTDLYKKDIFTVTANLAGLPALAVPVALDRQGMPLGLQLVGRAFDEASLLRSARVIEQAAGGPFFPVSQERSEVKRD